MILVISILLAAAVLAYGASNLRAAIGLLWRSRHGHVDSYARQATTATVWTMATLMILATVTLLYLFTGKSPTDFLLMVGLRLPLSANREMLIVGFGLQALLKLWCIDRYERSTERCYFPPALDRRGSDNQEK